MTSTKHDPDSPTSIRMARSFAVEPIFINGGKYRAVWSATPPRIVHDYLDEWKEFPRFREGGMTWCVPSAATLEATAAALARGEDARLRARDDLIEGSGDLKRNSVQRMFIDDLFLAHGPYGGHGVITSTTIEPDAEGYVIEHHDCDLRTRVGAEIVEKGLARPTRESLSSYESGDYECGQKLAKAFFDPHSPDKYGCGHAFHNLLGQSHEFDIWHEHAVRKQMALQIWREVPGSRDVHHAELRSGLLIGYVRGVRLEELS